MTQPRRRVMVFVEANTITGPIKGLINFCLRAREHAEGADVSLVTFRRPRPSRTRGTPAPEPDLLAARAREWGVLLDVIYERFRFDPAVIPQMRKIVSARAPDIIQTSHVKSHFLAKVSGIARGRPWIAFHHGYTTTDLKMRAYNQMDRWSLRGANRVVTVCRAFQGDLERIGIPPERIAVVHNAIDAVWCKPAEDAAVRECRESFDVCPGRRLVLSIGRLSHEKGQRFLVRAMDHLRRLHPPVDARLVLAGDGPERSSLKDLARSLNLADRVRFAGHVNDTSLYYHSADLLVLPSMSEGSPNVLLEAMAYRVPIVATDVGGIPEMVRDGESALLVRARDPRAMAAAMHRMLTDPELAGRLAARGGEVVERFSVARRVGLILGLYRELWANPPSWQGLASESLEGAC